MAVMLKDWAAVLKHCLLAHGDPFHHYLTVEDYAQLLKASAIISKDQIPIMKLVNTMTCQAVKKTTKDVKQCTLLPKCVLHGYRVCGNHKADPQTFVGTFAISTFLPKAPFAIAGTPEEEQEQVLAESKQQITVPR